MDAVPKVDQKQPHVVCIPCPAQSHIKCMLKLARLLNLKGFHVTFINTQTNQKLLENSGGTRWVDGAPGFQFKIIPDGLPSATTDDSMNYRLETNFLNSFIDVVSKLEIPVTCIVCDAFITPTNIFSAAEKLKIPIMLFWTVAACGFMGVYQAKVLMEKGLIPLNDESYLTDGYLDMKIDWIPGMRGILLKELPDITKSTTMSDPRFKFLLKSAQGADKVSHIIIHTFEELEASLIKELKSIFPSIYFIGPLELILNQNTKRETTKSNFNNYSLLKEEPECIQWLQSKEPNSVLYVNFGSLVVLSLQEILEFGWGLVNNGHEFLWIIRTDLPQELKEAVNGKGFIASWCSQEEVLNHASIGGFLTHGGWGSIIESLSAGVPMICWPLFGDQSTNCRQMCKEWEVGMKLSRDVKMDEVEKLVNELMEGGEGKRMRKKALEWKKMAEKATGFNGSSSLDIEKLANEIVKFSTS